MRLEIRGKRAEGSRLKAESGKDRRKRKEVGSRNAEGGKERTVIVDCGLGNDKAESNDS